MRFVNNKIRGAVHVFFKQKTNIYLLILFTSYRMSDAGGDESPLHRSGAGGDESPLETPGSQGPKKTRGPTTGSTSAKAALGVPDAKVVRYDPINQTFYQDVRKTIKKVGVFNNRVGALVKVHIPVTLRDWNEVTPQMLGNILSALHSEYTFVYKDDETEELLPADCYRHQIDQTIIRDAKRMRRNQKSRLSGTFLGKCCGQMNVAKKEIPKGYQKDDWEKVIEEFATDDWKVMYNSKKLCYLL